MSTKLTLTIEKSVIEEAKKFARSQGRSLSNLIEEYLKLVVKKEELTEEFEISPIVKSLWGSVKPLPDNKSYKEILAEEIFKKHMR